MKKFLCILLSLVMVMSLFTACGDDSGSGSNKDSESQSETSKTDGKENENSDAVDAQALTYTEIADVIEQSASSTTKTTASMKFEVASEDLFAEGGEAVAEMFGWTNNTASLEFEMSVVATTENSGKFSMNIYTGEKKELVGIDDILVVGEDIYISVAEINGVIDSIAALGGEEVDSASIKDMVAQLVGDKKYISINLTSLITMLENAAADYTYEDDYIFEEDYEYDVIYGDDYIYEDYEFDDYEYDDYEYDDYEYDDYEYDDYEYDDDYSYASGMDMETMMQLYETYEPVITSFMNSLESNETFIKALETAVEEAGVVAATSNSVTITLNKATVKAFAEKLVTVAKENSDFLSTLFVDTVYEITKLSGEELPADEEVADAKSEIKAALDELDTTWAEINTEYDEMLEGIDFNGTLSIVVDEKDSNLYSINGSLELKAPDYGFDKVAFSSVLSVTATTDTVTSPSASECISFEQLAVLLSGTGAE